jgi:putative CocE/NonD family hydrolase
MSQVKKRYVDMLIELKEKDSISINEARLLCRRLASLKTLKKVIPLTLPILSEYEEENYIIEEDVEIPMRSNSKLSAIVIRPKKTTGKLPIIFVFNIYAGKVDKRMAKKAAKNGYIGIVVNNRGKRKNTDKTEPFEHDAKDIYDAIDWMSNQPWSNGKVAMFGSSYLGFAQWAAAKSLHPALKAIVPQVSVGIGIDYPMGNNVFMSYMLQWIHYVENNNTTDLAEFSDTKKWNAVYEKWYREGLSFRSLDSVDGRPNKTFQKWLDHPSYDDFWQNMTPNSIEFSKINIPVLSITGYFDADQRGAFYYFNQHYKYNKNANHSLLIGPYDHGGAQGTPQAILYGYKIDSVANIDIKTTLYKWFDYVLKGAKKPEILKDKINYQVMGRNKWKHVDMLNKMNTDTLTFYLDSKLMSDYYNLIKNKPKKTAYIRQEVDFKDRSDYKKFFEEKTPILIDSTFSKDNGMAFITNTFESSFEINGSFIGELYLSINKKDLDISMELFEVTPDNKYFPLSSYLGRASYAKNNTKRQLLKPNKKEKIPIRNTFFVSKLISKGSKLLFVLSVSKNPVNQINYGTGKDVSDETIKDAKIPLKVKWFNDSFIKIPINR